MTLRALRPACLLLLALLAALPAQAAIYDMPAEGDDLVGALQHIETREEDTFVKLARRYNVGYRELRLANPEVDPWLPGEGTEVAFTCWCGEEQAHLLGRRAAPADRMTAA